LKLSKLLLFILLGFRIDLWAQSPARGDFMFPVRPTEENYLSGTMGELRATHFHTGLDIKTSGISGLKVYAAAVGYVQRIRVSVNGYGNALYLVHPHNNTITVYAHLQSFQTEVAGYVRNEQYKKESFEVNLFPSKDQFVFEKGDVIGFSGNSGSSSGPHLHFEIRDLNHKILDPLQFGFDEIIDNIAPQIQQMAFVTMDIDSRVNGMFGRFEYNVMDNDSATSLEEPVTLLGNIGVEVYAYDQFDGARNRNGALNQTLMLDFEPIFSQSIQTLDFNFSRNILVHANYKRMQEGGRRFNKLYVDEGNQLDFYQTGEYSGILKLMDPLTHALDVRLEDSYGNISQYHFPINDDSFKRSTQFKNMVALRKSKYDIRGDVLELISSHDGYNCPAKIYIDGFENIQYPSYVADDTRFYLWDLRWGMPDSSVVCNEEVIKHHFVDLVPSGQKAWIEEEQMAAYFPKSSLFDSIYLQYDYSVDPASAREIFNFNNPDVPLNHFITVDLMPTKNYDQSKSAVYKISVKGDLGFVGGKWENGKITFKTRNLVTHTIATDSVAPSISQLKSKKPSARFKIKDKLSGIGSYRGELDGQWLLMNFDAKSGILWSDERKSLKGKFVLKIEDNAENISTFEKDF